MTGRDPLAEWFPDDSPGDLSYTATPKAAWRKGANDRLDALRPLIAAADLLAADLRHAWHNGFDSGDTETLLATYDALTTPKGDTP